MLAVVPLYNNKHQRKDLWLICPTRLQPDPPDPTTTSTFLATFSTEIETAMRLVCLLFKKRELLFNKRKDKNQ